MPIAFSLLTLLFPITSFAFDHSKKSVIMTTTKLKNLTNYLIESFIYVESNDLYLSEFDQILSTLEKSDIPKLKLLNKYIKYELVIINTLTRSNYYNILAYKIDKYCQIIDELIIKLTCIRIIIKKIINSGTHLLFVMKLKESILCITQKINVIFELIIKYYEDINLFSHLTIIEWFSDMFHYIFFQNCPTNSNTNYVESINNEIKINRISDVITYNLKVISTLKQTDCKQFITKVIIEMENEREILFERYQDVRTEYLYKNHSPKDILSPVDDHRGSIYMMNKLDTEEIILSDDNDNINNYTTRVKEEIVIKDELLLQIQVQEESKVLSLANVSPRVSYLQRLCILSSDMEGLGMSILHQSVYCIVLYCIVLYCIVLYCIVLYCIV